MILEKMEFFAFFVSLYLSGAYGGIQSCCDIQCISPPVKAFLLTIVSSGFQAPSPISLNRFRILADSHKIIYSNASNKCSGAYLIFSCLHQFEGAIISSLKSYPSYQGLPSYRYTFSSKIIRNILESSHFVHFCSVKVLWHLQSSFCEMMGHLTNVSKQSI